MFIVLAKERNRDFKVIWTEQYEMPGTSYSKTATYGVTHAVRRFTWAPQNGNLEAVAIVRTTTTVAP